MTHLHRFTLHNTMDYGKRIFVNLDEITTVQEIFINRDGLGKVIDPTFSYTELLLSRGARLLAVNDRVLDILHWVKEIHPEMDELATNVCAHGCVICAPCNYIPESWKPA